MFFPEDLPLVADSTVIGFGPVFYVCVFAVLVIAFAMAIKACDKDDDWWA